MDIKSRFNKGDKVYSSETSYIKKSVACPDCLGQKSWVIIMPNGRIENVGCQTCRRGWESANGFVEYSEFSPVVKLVTIGSIRYDGTDNEDSFSYMCEETGIGSGRVYYDKDLFLKEDEAMEAAKIKNEQQMKSVANNNFKTTKEIENLLSTFGFTRKEAVQKAKMFKNWMKISKII